MIAVLCLCGITASMVHTMVIPLIPHLPQMLGSTPVNTAWVISATLLAGAVVTPVSGRLGDMFGKRRVLLWCLGLIVIGSVICALATSLPTMVLGRTLQGLAIGTVPLGISIMRDELSVERMPLGISLMSATMGVGGSAGLPLAAVVLEHTSWPALFFATAVVGAACMVAIRLLVPESPVKSPGRIDMWGILGLSIALVSALAVLTKGYGWGFLSPRVLVLVAIALVVGAVWFWWQLRIEEPLVDLRTSARPAVLWTNLVAVMLAFGMYAQGLSFPQMMTAPTSTGYGLGLSMLVAGLTMAPGGAAMMLFAPLAARLSQIRGPRITLTIGCLAVGAGYVMPLWLHTEIWHFMVAATVMSTGIAFGYAAMPTLIMSSVPMNETAAANGLNALMRSMGLAMSGTMVTVILGSYTMQVGEGIFPTMQGFRVVYVASLASCVLGALCTFIIPRGTRLESAPGLEEMAPATSTTSRSGSSRRRRRRSS